jgi:hypothetical protein
MLLYALRSHYVSSLQPDEVDVMGVNRLNDDDSDDDLYFLPTRPEPDPDRAPAPVRGASGTEDQLEGEAKGITIEENRV